MTILYDSRKHKIIDQQTQQKVSFQCPKCESTDVLVKANDSVVCSCRSCGLVGFRKRTSIFIRVEHFGEIFESGMLNRSVFKK